MLTHCVRLMFVRSKCTQRTTEIPPRPGGRLFTEHSTLWPVTEGYIRAGYSFIFVCRFMPVVRGLLSIASQQGILVGRRVRFGMGTTGPLY